MTIFSSRNYKAHLENHLKSAEYPLERVYVLHEIARTDMLNDRLDDCKLIARKCELEADACGSHVFRFLAILKQLKAEIAIQNYDKQAELLAKMRDVAHTLKDDRLSHIVTVGMGIVGVARRKSVTSFEQ